MAQANHRGRRGSRDQQQLQAAVAETDENGHYDSMGSLMGGTACWRRLRQETPTPLVVPVTRDLCEGNLVSTGDSVSPSTSNYRWASR